MATIRIATKINAPAERCFDLSRSVDLHVFSSSDTNEEAVAGTTTGLMTKGDWVTWRAKHLGFYSQLTSEISESDRPAFFVSKMIRGPFRKILHRHIFEEHNGSTLMTDIFEFEAPLWILGKMAEYFFLAAYMKRFLEKRNATIKRAAESDEWIKILKTPGT